MLQKIWKIGKSILFVGVLALTLYGVTLTILPKIPDFYEEDDWNVVFFGTSQSYCSFDPQIFDEYGMRTYNRGRQQQTMNYTYYYVKDALDVSDIDIVVLEVYGMFYDEGDEGFTNESIRESSLGDFRYSPIKMEAIKDCVPEELQMPYLFPLDKYHSNWQRWDFSSLEKFQKSVLSPYYSEPSDRGYMRWTGSQWAEYASWAALHSGYHEDIYEENMRYLQMIKELCDEKGAKLLLVRAPLPCHEWVIGKTNTLWDWAIDNHVDMINYMLLTERCGLDFSTDSLDGGAHLNESGAGKVSRYLAEYIMDNYYDWNVGVN